MLGEIHQILLNDFSMQMSPKTVNYGRKNLGFGVGFGYCNNTTWQCPSTPMDPHPTHDSYGPSEPTTQTASLSVQPSCTDDRRVSLYFTMGRSFSPKNLPLPMRDLDPHLIHGSPDPPKCSTQTAARSVQPFLQGLLV